MRIFVGATMNGLMAEVLGLDHAGGEAAGVLAFADRLRHGGHIVHVADLYVFVRPRFTWRLSCAVSA